LAGIKGVAHSQPQLIESAKAFPAFQPITMPNGFTYHWQELAFFSWFFGAPSIGVNGWFSDNGTFMTDAGPPCH
jgi:hypothetical protein